MTPGMTPDKYKLFRYTAAGMERGWSFTPLNGKRPFLDRWQSQDRASMATVRGWIRAGHNIGLRTGNASGVAVIDLDPGADRALDAFPATVTATTGRDGGHHLYYSCEGPMPNSVGKVGKGIDVRGDGGQVVFPGSAHPDTGRVYDWLDGRGPDQIALAPFPMEVLPKPKQAAPMPRVRVHVPAMVTDPVRRYILAVLERKTAHVATASEGSRNQTLNGCAYALGRFVGGGYLSEDEVEASLLAAASTCGLDDQEAVKTLHSGLRSGMRKPRANIEARIRARRCPRYLVITSYESLQEVPL